MECDLCGETCRKREARETSDGNTVCPDCADGMTKCEECELLFDQQHEETVCENCREDEDEGEDEDEPSPARVPSVMEYAREIAEAFYRSSARAGTLGPVDEAWAREIAVELVDQYGTLRNHRGEVVRTYSRVAWMDAFACALLDTAARVR
jgi:hypothetical protein